MSMEALFFNIFLVVAFIVAAMGLYNLKTSESWKEIKGQITKLEMSENFNRYNSTNRNVVEFPVDVTFEYTVADKKYQGSKIFAGLPNVFTDHEEAKKFMDEYQDKKEISVYYNTKNPDESALKRITISTFAFIVLGGLLIAIVSGMYFVFHKFIAN